VGLWIENSWFSLGYLKIKCEDCSSRIWKIGILVASLDNTKDGLCPKCSNFVDA
jgi:hypothetical protein